MLPLGFTHGATANTVLAFYFLSILFGTFTFDLLLFGFECLPKANRDNYIIILAATKVAGIIIVSLSFYLLKKWVYFIVIQMGLMIVFLGLFIKYAYDSPLQIMVSTASHDLCKYVLNRIAIINEEEIITEKLAFSTPTAVISQRRSFVSLVKNTFNHRIKANMLTILGLCWFAYVTGQMVHFVFLNRLQLNIYVDVIILGATEFLSALFSKVLFKKLTRRTSLMLTFLFVFTCFFFLLIFTPSNTQARYAVTISTRAALQIIYIVLTVATMEQFPTEVRGTSLSVCMCFGLLGGVSLPFFNELGTELIILLIIIYGTAAVSVFFLRETSKEEALKNMCFEIIPEKQDSVFDNMRND